MSELFDLMGKVAVVTGASRGLGSAMALGLAGAGAKIVAADILNTDRTVGEIKKLGSEAIGIKVDVVKKDEVEKMVQTAVKKFGRIDILINDAGIIRVAPSETMKEEDWDSVVDVNMKGVFLCAQAVGKQMIKQRSGKIINIASTSGQVAFVQPVSGNSAPYNASKAGVIMLTKTLAAEWGRYNIQVNAICPGFFRTDMSRGILSDENYMKILRARLPLGKPAEPENLVGTAIYLASRASDYVTGHALVIDGGLTVGI